MDDNFIIIPEKTIKGYAEAYDGDGVYINRPHQKRGVVQKGAIQTIKTQPNDIGVVVKETTKKGYIEAKIRVIGNYSPSNHDASRIVDVNGVAPTVKENHGTVTAVYVPESLRIRKLTPREAFRLMGVKDRDYDKIADFSDSSLYKLAGNSIVIQVLMGIFGELLGIDYKKKIKESVKEIV